MSQDTAVNPYDAPAAELDAATASSEIRFCPPKGIRGGEGFSIFGDAWQIFKQAPWLWIGTTFSLFILMILLSLIPIAGQIATALLVTPMAAGLYMGAEEIRNGGSLKFGHLFAAFSSGKGGRLMGFAVVYMVMYIVAMAVPLLALGQGNLLPLLLGQEAGSFNPAGMMAGFAVMMIVGLALSMVYWFAVPLIALQDQKMFEAMGNSLKGCLKNIWPLTLYGLAMMFWMIVATIPIGLGLFVMIPVLYISCYTGYRRIFTE